MRMIFNSLIGIVTGRFGFSGPLGQVGTAQAVTQAASAGLKQTGAAVSNIVYIMLISVTNLGIVVTAAAGARRRTPARVPHHRSNLPQAGSGKARTLGAQAALLLICLVLAVCVPGHHAHRNRRIRGRYNETHFKTGHGGQCENRRRRPLPCSPC